ncbi:MAG: hypothetical protein WCG27_05565, partial [Pseudomonadota bacterium]
MKLLLLLFIIEMNCWAGCDERVLLPDASSRSTGLLEYFQEDNLSFHQSAMGFIQGLVAKLTPPEAQKDITPEVVEKVFADFNLEDYRYLNSFSRPLNSDGTSAFYVGPGKRVALLGATLKTIGVLQKHQVQAATVQAKKKALLARAARINTELAMDLAVDIAFHAGELSEGSTHQPIVVRAAQRFYNHFKEQTDPR